MTLLLTKPDSRIDKAVRRISVAVGAAGGVLRTRTLAASGVSAHDIREAVARADIVRVRRGWVALPTAEPALVKAARDGVVLTCVSQARRLGLWVLADESELHVGAPPHAGGIVTGTAHVHWGRPPVPRHPDSVTDPVENVLWAVAGCQPELDALAIWESALRKKLTSLEVMRRLVLPPAARRLCDVATPWSDSGLESFIPPRLRWLGFRIVPQAWIAGHRVDFLIAERLVLQIDGGSHVGAQREQDIAHDALLTLQGYHVIRVGYRQVTESWHQVQDLIMRAVAQGLHLDR